MSDYVFRILTPEKALERFVTRQELTAIIADIEENSSPSYDSADQLPDGLTKVVMTIEERDKLTGIAPYATANESDASLRNRVTHTGTQPATTITGLAPVATSGAYSDLTGKVPPEALPDLAILDIFPVASQTAMLALVAQRGDIAVRTDQNGQMYILKNDIPNNIDNWLAVGSSAGGITSVNGKSGTFIVLSKADIGLGNVNDTSDANKPVSNAQAAAINAKYTKPASGIPLSDLAISGTPSANTSLRGDGTWATAISNADLALKANLASPALTGTPTAPTAAAGTNTTQLATTAFVAAAIAAAIAAGGNTGGNGGTPSPAYTDNGDGTITYTSSSTDNGNGTVTLPDGSYTDNGNGTITIG